MNRSDFIEGQRVERVREHLDPEGMAWTVLELENGRAVYIRDIGAWILVEPEAH